MVAMLTHLHHTPRVGPAQHRWARDAVVAAQLGAAALVVVTALEWRGESRGDTGPGPMGTPAASELVQTEPASHPRSTFGSPGFDLPTSPASPVGTNSPSSVAISVQHGTGTSSSAIGAPIDALGGPVEVRVIDGSFITVATALVNPGDQARIANLPAGTYRLILAQTTGVSEPTPGVAISAASSQLTDPVQVVAGDVLLVSLQPRPA